MADTRKEGKPPTEDPYVSAAIELVQGMEVSVLLGGDIGRNFEAWALCTLVVAGLLEKESPGLLTKVYERFPMPDKGGVERFVQGFLNHVNIAHNTEVEK